MEPQKISVLEWHRLLMGTTPAAFLLEMLVRCLVVYTFFVLIVRVLGKRMSGQVANLELGVMITLGAIVSVPLQVAERGIVPALVLLLAVLALHQLLSWGTARYFKMEQLVQGHAKLLTKNGELMLDELREVGMSQEQLFSVLRSEKLRHLGEVKRVYLEACGTFSIIRNPTPHPGLSVLPRWDTPLQNRIPRAEELCACRFCGHVVLGSESETACARCSRTEFTAAVAGAPETDEARRNSQQRDSGEQSSPEAAE
ncbi:MAG TPA: YetF domain-containing protein [Polyangiaceae bacterium]|nr:YetF domain-containing protein [Polyangiaceae bacterium]